MVSRIQLVLAFAVVLVAGSVSASAQTSGSQGTGSARASGGLFGGAPGEDGRHNLFMTASVAEGYDDDVLGEVRPSFDPNQPRASGYFTTLIASGAYRRRTARLDVSASGGTAFRYIGSLDDFRPVSHNVSVGLIARFTPRLTLSADQTAAYVPSRLYDLFATVGERPAGESAATASDYMLGDSESYVYGTSLRLTRTFSPRTSLGVAGEFQFSDYPRRAADDDDESGRSPRDLTTHAGSARFSRALTKNAVFTSTYQYRKADFAYAAGSGITEQGANAGLEWSRLLSATRRAWIGFTMGVSRVTVPNSGDAGLVEGHHDRLTGGATIAYQFGRSWTARGGYRTEVVYVADLSQPVVVDGFSATLSGLLTRRLDLELTAGYSSGDSALQRNTLVFDTYTADARVRFALTRTLAAYAQYLYYMYDFGQGTTRPPGLPNTLERNGVRVGLTLWVAPLGR